MTGYARYEVPFGNFDINEFKGYNATSARANSEMPDMMNLSSEKYPYLSPREPRSNVELPEGAGLISKIFRANGKLAFIAGGEMWYDGKVVLRFPAGKKSVAVCNGKICVAPDLVYYDYLNDVSGRMDGRIDIYVSNNMTSLYRRRTLGISLYEHISGEVKAFPWGDHMKIGDTVRIYEYAKGILSDEYTVIGIEDEKIVKLEKDDGTGISEDIGGINGYFKGIVIINCDKALIFCENKLAVVNDTDSGVYSYTFGFADGAGTEYINHVDEFSKKYITFEKDDVVKILSESGDDGDTEYMIGSVSHGKSGCVISFDRKVPDDVYGLLTVTRTVPVMDHICERDNRLFGVCSKDNTVVASKLGQPFNFRYFSGTSVDSYSVEVGSDGEFTGIATYAGNVILFKERYIHMLTGTKPSMYRLSGIETYGCQKGCDGSICSLSGRLIYKSPGGVYMFDGGYPVCISKVFGTERYYDAFAADDDRRYYISMEDGSGKRRLYVYDTYSGFWHIEDSERAVSMCEVSGEVYIAYVDRIEKIGGGDGRVSWFAQFGPFDLYSANKKVISAVVFRYKLPPRSSLCIEVSVDGGEYEVMREVYYTTDTVLECNIPLRRCNEFSLRLSGVGDVEVRGISFKLREGAGTR